MKALIIGLALAALVVATEQASDCEKCSNWVRFHLMYSTTHALEWEEVYLQVRITH